VTVDLFDLETGQVVKWDVANGGRFGKARVAKLADLVKDIDAELPAKKAAKRAKEAKERAAREVLSAAREACHKTMDTLLQWACKPGDSKMRETRIVAAADAYRKAESDLNNL
jgi:hypothetical protein